VKSIGAPPFFTSTIDQPGGLRGAGYSGSPASAPGKQGVLTCEQRQLGVLSRAVQFEVQRSTQIQWECSEATSWEDFKVAEGSGQEAAREAVQAAAKGEPGCYRTRPLYTTGPFAFYRVTADGIAHREE
jgi:hypothetical protein